MSIEVILTIYIASIVFILLEIVIPNGFSGIIGVIGMIIGIILSLVYIKSWYVSGAMILFSFFVIPYAAYLVLGRLRITTNLKSSEGYTTGQKKFEMLLDKEGKAITPLRPVGIIKIEGKKYDAISELGIISKKDKVKVVRVDEFRIFVRKV